MTVLPNWQVYSDGELARAAAAGDRQAFAAIYDRHADPRHDFCVGMLRNRDAASSAPPKNPPTTTGVRFCATGRPYPREPTPIKGVAMNAKIIGNVMPVLVVTLNPRRDPDRRIRRPVMDDSESIQLRTSTRMAGAQGSSEL